jgi:hypothetical protein
MSYNIGDWMWIVGDTNPTTQVYSSASGGMIANNSAAFLTWLTGRTGAIAIGDHDGYSIGAAADNGSGLIRLTITTTARMQTGQRWAVAGSGSASVDGNWPVTVIDGTHIDLQGSNSAHAGAVTGGYVLGATFIDTMANLTSVLNRAAFTRFQEATRSFTSAVDLALDNPLAATSLISMTASGRSVTLPAMNAVNAVPVGIPFVMVNTGGFTFTLKDKAGTALGELAPQASWQLINTTNATIAGAFQTIVTLYNSGTGGILQTAPKTATAAAQGSWTHLAHQSNPGQFDGRNNEVWGFGYNLSNAWSSRNGLDDGIGMGWETHYHPSSGIGPQFEAHLCRVGKKGGGEFRPLSFVIQKWDSTAPVGAYWTAGSALVDEFTINRPSNNASVFAFNTHAVGSPTSKGQAFFVDADLTMEGDTLTHGVFQSFNQKNASFDIVQQWQKSGTSKWQIQVRASQANVDWWFYDNVRASVHTTLYSNGGIAIGAPTGGDQGSGKLNAEGLYVNGNAISAEQYLADQNPILNPSGQVIDKALAVVSDNNYTWTPWIALSQGGNITPSQLTDVENATSYMMRFAQAGANRFGAIQPIAKDLCKQYRGQTVTLTARVRINTAHTIRYAVIEWTGTADVPTTDVVNDWTSGTFTAGNFFKSTNLTITSTGSVTPGTSTLASISLTATLGSSFNNVLVFFWVDSAEAANLDIGRVGLAIGTSTALIAPRPYPLEQRLCDWLFQMYDVFATNSSVSVGQAYSATQALAALVFRAPMRIAPTGSVSAGSDFACVNATASSANSCAAVAFSGTTKTNTRLDFSGSSGLVAGNCTMIQLNGSASDAKIYLDARITPA